MTGFERKVDADDLTAGVHPDEALGDLNTKLTFKGLHFPLVCDEFSGIAAHLKAQPFAPESLRFGSFADNVLAAELKVGGGSCRLGAPLVKNVTGFELKRFALADPACLDRLGTVVLRLRTRAAARFAVECSGQDAALDGFLMAVVRGTWRHALDRADFVVEEGGTTLHLAGGCEQDLVPAVMGGLRELVKTHGVTGAPVVSSPEPGLPKAGVRVRTLVSKAPVQARALVAAHGGRAHGFGGNGFFVYEPPAGSTGALEACRKLDAELKPLAGYVRIPGEDREGGEVEQTWLASLHGKWGIA